MQREPLPLNALRVLEACARHQSFRHAAEELHVTPAAVSHAVKSLEQTLGVFLFERTTRAIRPTAATERAVIHLRTGFDALEDAVTELKRQRDDKVLKISVGASFAYRWLLPRLEDFRQRHPDLNVRVDASNELADFHRGDADIALRFGRGRYGDDVVSERLITDVAFPVCAPSLIDNGPGLNEPADITGYPLLHVNWTMEPGEEPSWNKWLARAGVESGEIAGGVTFTMDDMAVLTAIEGRGITIAMTAFVADDLRAGRLIKPFDDRYDMPVSFQHYLVYPKTSRQTPKVKAFRDWIRAAIVAFQSA